jgi:hypothetical protein
MLLDDQETKELRERSAKFLKTKRVKKFKSVSEQHPHLHDEVMRDMERREKKANAEAA